MRVTILYNCLYDTIEMKTDTPEANFDPIASFSQAASPQISLNLTVGEYDIYTLDLKDRFINNAFDYCTLQDF